MAAPRALITGIAGFAGTYLARELRARGADVTGYTLSVDPGSEFAAATIAGDVTDLEQLAATISEVRPDVVYHLAGYPAVGQAWQDREQVFAVNTLGAAVCAEAAARTPGTRVVLASSGLVYGQVEADDLPIIEDQPLRPRGPYAASKACAEIAATEIARAAQSELVIVRPFNFLGPGQGLGFVAPDFASQVAAIERGEHDPIIRVGNLDAQRDFTDVRDLVRAVADAGERGEPGRAYNACSGNAVAISHVLEILLREARMPIEVESDPERMRPSDVPCFIGDNTRARDELGWEPHIGLQHSLAETLAWWRQRV